MWSELERLNELAALALTIFKAELGLDYRHGDTYGGIKSAVHVVLKPSVKNRGGFQRLQYEPKTLRNVSKHYCGGGG